MSGLVVSPDIAAPLGIVESPDIDISPGSSIISGLVVSPDILCSGIVSSDILTFPGIL